MIREDKLATWLLSARHRVFDIVAVISVSSGINILTSLLPTSSRLVLAFAALSMIGAGALLTLVSVRAALYSDLAERKHERNKDKTPEECLEAAIRENLRSAQRETIGFLAALLWLAVSIFALLREMLKHL